LQHQLEVAAGARAPLAQPAAYAPPLLRRHPAPRGRSAYAFRMPSDRLRVRSAAGSWSAGEARRPRRWRTMRVEMAPLQELTVRAGGFTYNDLLAASALESFRLWNARAVDRRAPRIGLWVPVDIRDRPYEGFGNGSSRIRVYNRYSPTAGLHDKCRIVRQQLEWSRQHGEWAVPELRALMRLPVRVLRPLLRGYFNRPWVDMGTGTFSHVQRSPLDTDAFNDVEGIDIVGMLDTRHVLGVFAMSRAGATHLTFVYDPHRLDVDDVAELMSLYRDQLATALREGRE